MEQVCLNNFGKLLIEKVYDQTIYNYRSIIEYNVKAPRLQELAEKISALSLEEKDLMDKIVFEVVDDILFYFLNTLEEEEEKLKLFYYKDTKTSCDLVQLSDGLAGELVSEDGWICKYSKYRNNIEC